MHIVTIMSDVLSVSEELAVFRVLMVLASPLPILFSHLASVDP